MILWQVVSDSGTKCTTSSYELTNGGTSEAVDIVINVNGETQTFAKSFTYKKDWNPTVTSVSPKTLSVCGGTKVYIFL